MPEDTTSVTNVSHHISDGSLPLGQGWPIKAQRGDLTVEQILAWADAHHAAHGEWPEGGVLCKLMAVDGVPGESWKAIDRALAMGLRGLPGKSSLALLLAEHRGAVPPDRRSRALSEPVPAQQRPPFDVDGQGDRLGRLLTPGAILAWADAHHQETGTWPSPGSGPVRHASFRVSWAEIDAALRKGQRVLPQRTTLSRLLIAHRGAPPRPPLSVEQILAWADAHHTATGTWPKYKSGRVLHAPGEEWSAIHNFLRNGGRGLPGGMSMLGLLAEQRGVRDRRTKHPLTIEQILAWADAHHAATGKWPASNSGQVRDAPFEVKWASINTALATGIRGLPGGTTLKHLLIEHRGFCRWCGSTKLDAAG